MRKGAIALQSNVAALLALHKRHRLADRLRLTTPPGWDRRSKQPPHFPQNPLQAVAHEMHTLIRNYLKDMMNYINPSWARRRISMFGLPAFS
jgi:hypothetical protein